MKNPWLDIFFLVLVPSCKIAPNIVVGEPLSVFRDGQHGVDVAENIALPLGLFEPPLRNGHDENGIENLWRVRLNQLF